MQSRKTELVQAPALQTRVLFFDNMGDTPPASTVENKGTSNSVALVYQESDDGQNWTDILGATVSIAPGKSDARFVVSTKRKLALAAQGNEPILVSIDRTINGTVTDLGPA